jgi:hypothetical protein
MLGAPFHLNRAGKENVIFQVNVLMKIALKFWESRKKIFEARARVRWSPIVAAQAAHAAQQVSG